MDEKEYGLSTSKSEFGKSIIEMAEETRKHKMRESIIGVVEGLMNQIDGQNKISLHHASMRDFYKRRLEAIETGNFEILGDGRIKYTNDAELNDQTK
jgi:hypothetical protein